MALLKASRTAQNVMEGEFTFSIGDTMVNTSGASDAFAATGAHVFDVINLPPGATVVGGSVTTDTAFATSTAYNVTVGDSVTATRYLGTTDRVAAGTTALVPTGFIGAGENLRLTVTPTVAAATAGKITVRVLYTVLNRVNEIVSS